MCAYMYIYIYIIHIKYHIQAFFISNDPFFIFSLVFIIINHIISLKQTHLFFSHFLEYLMLVLHYKMDKESEQFLKRKKFSLRVLLSFCLIFYQFQLGVLIKVLFIKNRKSVYIYSVCIYIVYIVYNIHIYI